MKKLFLLLTIFSYLTIQNPSVFTYETSSEDLSVYTRRKEPTKEDILVATFREELPQAKELIMRESGNNPCKINGGAEICGYRGDRACGVPQSLPCAKMGCELSHDIRDYACQIRWMKNYVEGRYGSFANALNWHNLNNWY